MCVCVSPPCTNLLSLLGAGVVSCVKASAAELSLFTRCLWEELEQNKEKMKSSSVSARDGSQSGLSCTELTELQFPHRSGKREQKGVKSSGTVKFLKGKLRLCEHFKRNTLDLCLVTVIDNLIVCF